MNSDALVLLRNPRWLAVILCAVTAAVLGALWIGLQQDERHTATTYIFGRRVGYLERPLVVLDDHLNDIVNAVEFPEVFLAIEDRTQLRADTDYDFTIERLDGQQSVISVEVRAQRAGDAERIARILAEEVTTFVLQSQLETVQGEIGTVDGQIALLEMQQQQLRAGSFDISPVVAANSIERLLREYDEVGVVAPETEAELLRKRSLIQPLVGDYQRNGIELNRLAQDRARLRAEELDIDASIIGVNGDWYRSITPVEPASNIPLAIAMAFSAGVPTLFAATALVILNLNRRLTGRLLPRRDPVPIPA